MSQRHSPWVEAYYHQGDQQRAAKGCGEGVTAMRKERLFQTEADNSRPDITDILERRLARKMHARASRNDVSMKSLPQDLPLLTMPLSLPPAAHRSGDGRTEEE